MAETTRARRSGAERLLLLAALLLGLVTMHTLGHEPAGHGPAMAAAASPTANVSAGHDHADRPAAPAAAQDGPSVARRSPLPAHPSGGGPLVVCLAVLGALVVVVGGVTSARERRNGRARPSGAGVRWSAGADAPPPPADVLDRVAVLRI